MIYLTTFEFAFLLIVLSLSLIANSVCFIFLRSAEKHIDEYMLEKDK